jgi:TRAP-type C4-dicarboxylate transport system permease small subunit
MRSLIKSYDVLVVALACVAGAIPLFILFAVVLGVATRSAGLQPPVWTQAYTEHALLYGTMLVAPWLVRRKAHVFVESLVVLLPGAVQRLLEKLVYVLCILIALVFAYFMLEKFIFHLSSGEYETRSVDMPLWLVFATPTVAFFLIAVEFARYLLGPDSMYSGRVVARDKL